MKVLMFGWEFPPIISGGLGIACYGIVQELTKKGVFVNFVMPSVSVQHQTFPNLNLISASDIEVTTTMAGLRQQIGEETIRFLLIDSILHPYWQEKDYPKNLHDSSKPIHHLKPNEAIGKLSFSGRYGPDLLAEVSRFAVVAGELCKNTDYDLIHAHDWMSFPAACEVKKKTGKPLICHVHATEYDRAGNNPSPHILNIEKHGMERADKIIAVSERTKNIIVRNYGIPAEKIQVVYNGIDRSHVFSQFLLPDPSAVKLMPKPQKPFSKIVLFLGRITHQKGPEYFLEAARLILKQRNDIYFIMAGDGDLLPLLMKEVAANRMHKHFHFTGFLNRDEVALLYTMSDVYVMPSVSEPFGISAYEAILFEVPSIVSHQSGVTEVIQNILKVDFWDVHGIANNIIYLIDNPKEAKEMGKAGAKELENQTWSTAVNHIMRIYKETLKL